MERFGSTASPRRPAGGLGDGRHFEACTGGTRRWSGSRGRRPIGLRDFRLPDLRPAPLASAQPRPGAGQPHDPRQKPRCCPASGSTPGGLPFITRALRAGAGSLPRDVLGRGAPGPPGRGGQELRFGAARGRCRSAGGLGRSAGLRRAPAWSPSGTGRADQPGSPRREALARGAVASARTARPGRSSGRPGGARRPGAAEPSVSPRQTCRRRTRCRPRPGGLRRPVFSNAGAAWSGRRPLNIGAAPHVRPGHAAPSKPHPDFEGTSNGAPSGWPS